MTDWKSGLRKAAEYLALNREVKAEGSKKSSTPPAAQEFEGSVAHERPGQPAIQGRPEGPPTEPRTPNPVAKTIGCGSGLAPGMGNIGEYEKQTKSKGICVPRPLPVPLRRPLVGGAGNPVRPRLGELAVTKREAVQGLDFRMPDMARYTICHGSSASWEDQGWQRIGTPTTLGPTENRGRAQCVVGLDFGTAFVKACVQFRHSIYVVHWNGAISSAMPFLLPGVFSVQRDGTCVLGSAPDARVYGDLKMGLLTGAESNAKFLATAFLALATRYIRSWLFANYGNVFSGFEIEWFVNVGLPAVPWENLKLRNLYEEITLAGWRLGASSGPITLDVAASALAGVQQGVLKSDQLEKGRICAFPEFVAQINSYRRSAQRRRDLHLLVDVGAGTVDMVTFHVWEPEEGDCYSILDAAVERMGTHILLGYRADAANLCENRFDEALSRFSVREFEAKFGLSTGKLGAAQHSFVDQIAWFLERLLRWTRSTRYGTSPTWEKGVPFFLAGGGNKVDAYRAAIRAISKNWRLEELVLPLPDGIVCGQLTRAEFHRVSVAYGLSDSADNIGLIERKAEVPDLHRAHAATAGYSDRYIEK